MHSFEFVRIPEPVRAKDTVVLLSHRGTKSFTVESAKLAHRLKTETVALTGRASPWEIPLTHRLETCDQEDTGAFTKSLTTTLAWIIRWIGSPKLVDEIRLACGVLSQGPDFPDVNAQTDLIFLGDAGREWIAKEISLKVQETGYLRAPGFWARAVRSLPRLLIR